MRRLIVGNVALVLLLGAWAAPAAASWPNVRVDPQTGLVDDQTVLVTGLGWARPRDVWIRQCSAGVWTGDQDACGPPVETAPIGGGHTIRHSFVVHTGAIGNGFCGLGAGTGTQRSCAIEVVQLDKDFQPTSTVALRRIVFAPVSGTG